MSNKVPQIRFNGYSDAWVQRNLSELLQERNQQIEPNEEYKLMSFVAGTGVTPKGERYDRSALVTNDSKKYKVTEFGDFIYSSNNLETGSIGFNRTGKAVISPVYSIFYSTENADSRFIGLLSSQKKFIHSMVRYRQGVVYGQWRIHESDFLKIAVSTPKLDEQDKIIDFFERFDNLIAANQRKLDLLKEQKKGYLQKMFPKNGAKVPELRFAGFADDWEERKLGEVFNQTVEYINPNEANLELWSVTVERGLTPKTARYNREALVKKNDKFKVVHDGDIVYNPMNLTIGAVGFNKSEKSVAVSGYYVTMNMNSGFNNSYFQTWLKSENAIKQYKLYATGSLIEKQRVQFPTLSLIKSYIPTFEEQQKIGSLFKQLDDAIALHQRKLELLKEQKKGFLQKMFV
ncbi:restriction endonuclease subunit S [Latilactobacillus sakei]|uniref:restriction endonuclease subunit S n=1 Tax=Latilactobacillus sakei TaxID=1599 RepID=UPI003CF59067